MNVHNQINLLGQDACHLNQWPCMVWRAWPTLFGRMHKALFHFSWMLRCSLIVDPTSTTETTPPQEPPPSATSHSSTSPVYTENGPYIGNFAHDEYRGDVSTAELLARLPGPDGARPSGKPAARATGLESDQEDSGMWISMTCQPTNLSFKNLSC